MLMKKSNGAAMSQYAIILAIVVLGIAITFGVLGKTIVKGFQSFSDGFGEDPKMSAINTHNVPANETQTPDNSLLSDNLKGTPEKPLRKCENGSCIIDFGDFVLSDIPEDFKEVIETSGSSAGTTVISSLIDQIAKQLAAQNKNTEAKEIQQLANLGHNVAAMEYYLEQTVNSCNGSDQCVKDILKKPMVKPENYDSSVLPFPENTSYLTLSDEILDIGGAQSKRMAGSAEYEKNLNNNYLAYKFVEQYNSILENKDISDPIKGVLKELSWDIAVVSEDTDNNIDFIAEPTTDNYFFDFSTGKSTKISAQEVTQPIEAFQSYNASKITNFDSALMCGAGQKSDSGTQCH